MLSSTLASELAEQRYFSKDGEARPVVMHNSRSRREYMETEGRRWTNKLNRRLVHAHTLVHTNRANLHDPGVDRAQFEGAEWDDQEQRRQQAAVNEAEEAARRDVAVVRAIGNVSGMAQTLATDVRVSERQASTADPAVGAAAPSPRPSEIGSTAAGGESGGTQVRTAMGVLQNIRIAREHNMKKRAREDKAPKNKAAVEEQVNEDEEDDTEYESQRGTLSVRVHMGRNLPLERNLDAGQTYVVVNFGGHRNVSRKAKVTIDKMAINESTNQTRASYTHVFDEKFGPFAVHDASKQRLHFEVIHERTERGQLVSSAVCGTATVRLGVKTKQLRRGSGIRRSFKRSQQNIEVNLKYKPQVSFDILQKRPPKRTLSVTLSYEPAKVAKEVLERTDDLVHLSDDDGDSYSESAASAPSLSRSQTAATSAPSRTTTGRRKQRFSGEVVLSRRSTTHAEALREDSEPSSSEFETDLALEVRKHEEQYHAHMAARAAAAAQATQPALAPQSPPVAAAHAGKDGDGSKSASLSSTPRAHAAAADRAPPAAGAAAAATTLTTADLRQSDLVYRGQLLVTVVKGEGLTNMDIMDLSDPYCVVKLSNDFYRKSNEVRTSVKDNTLNPEWNEELPPLAVTDLRQQQLHVSVFDKDIGFSDDFMGYFSLNLIDPELDLLSGRRRRVTVPLVGGEGSITLVLHFVQAQPAQSPSEQDVHEIFVPTHIEDRQRAMEEAASKQGRRGVLGALFRRRKGDAEKSRGDGEQEAKDIDEEKVREEAKSKALAEAKSADEKGSVSDTASDQEAEPAAAAAVGATEEQAAEAAALAAVEKAAAAAAEEPVTKVEGTLRVFLANPEQLLGPPKEKKAQEEKDEDEEEEEQDEDDFATCVVRVESEETTHNIDRTTETGPYGFELGEWRIPSLRASRMNFALFKDGLFRGQREIKLGLKILDLTSGIAKKVTVPLQGLDGSKTDTRVSFILQYLPYAEDEVPSEDEDDDDEEEEREEEQKEQRESDSLTEEPDQKQNEGSAVPIHGWLKLHLQRCEEVKSSACQVELSLSPGTQGAELKHALLLSPVSDTCEWNEDLGWLAVDDFMRQKLHIEVRDCDESNSVVGQQDISISHANLGLNSFDGRLRELKIPLKPRTAGKIVLLVAFHRKDPKEENEHGAEQQHAHERAGESKATELQRAVRSRQLQTMLIVVDEERPPSEKDLEKLRGRGGRLFVRILRADGLCDPRDGRLLGSHGSPSGPGVFCALHVGGQSQTTGVALTDLANPQWDASMPPFYIFDAADCEMKLDVIQGDPSTSQGSSSNQNIVLGTFTLPLALPSLQRALRNQGLQRSDESGAALVPISIPLGLHAASTMSADGRSLSRPLSSVFLEVGLALDDAEPQDSNEEDEGDAEHEEPQEAPQLLEEDEEEAAEQEQQNTSKGRKGSIFRSIFSGWLSKRGKKSKKASAESGAQPQRRGTTELADLGASAPKDGREEKVGAEAAGKGSSDAAEEAGEKSVSRSHSKTPSGEAARSHGSDASEENEDEAADQVPEHIDEPQAAAALKQEDEKDEEPEEDGADRVVIRLYGGKGFPGAPVYARFYVEESEDGAVLQSGAMRAKNPQWNVDLGELVVQDYAHQILRVELHEQRTLRKDRLLGSADIGMENLGDGALGEVVTDLEDPNGNLFGEITFTLRLRRSGRSSGRVDSGRVVPLEVAEGAPNDDDEGARLARPSVF